MPSDRHQTPSAAQVNVPNYVWPDLSIQPQ